MSISGDVLAIVLFYVKRWIRSVSTISILFYYRSPGKTRNCLRGTNRPLLVMICGHTRMPHQLKIKVQVSLPPPLSLALLQHSALLYELFHLKKCLLAIIMQNGFPYCFMFCSTFHSAPFSDRCTRRNLNAHCTTTAV